MMWIFYDRNKWILKCCLSNTKWYETIWLEELEIDVFNDIYWQNPKRLFNLPNFWFFLRLMEWYEKCYILWDWWVFRRSLLSNFSYICIKSFLLLEISNFLYFWNLESHFQNCSIYVAHCPTLSHLANTPNIIAHFMANYSSGKQVGSPVIAIIVTCTAVAR